MLSSGINVENKKTALPYLPELKKTRRPTFSPAQGRPSE